MLLRRAALVLFRPRIAMSVPTSALPKRALSTSPSPPALAAAASTTSQSAVKRAKIEGDDTPSAAQPELAVPAVIEALAAVANGGRVKTQGEQQKEQANKGRKGKGKKNAKGKAPKPGGVEEAGAFDVVEFLGAERVKELEESERNWKKESEEEWGFGANGKDIEVRIVGMSSHGKFELSSDAFSGAELTAIPRRRWTRTPHPFGRDPAFSPHQRSLHSPHRARHRSRRPPRARLPHEPR